MFTMSISDTRRLQLTRWFLRAVVAALVAGAAVAIIALLTNSFNETTARILISLGGLAIHCGAAMSAAAALERGLWPHLNRVGLLAFAVTFGVLMVGVWHPDGLDLPALRGMATALATLAAYVVAIPGANLLERGRHRPTTVAAVLSTVAAYGLLLVAIWGEQGENRPLFKAIFATMIVAGSLAQVCMLLHVPGSTKLVTLLTVTLLAIAGVAGMGIYAIYTELDNELYYRILGAVGVVDGCGTLSLAIVAWLKRIGPAHHHGIELRCPHCGAWVAVAGCQQRAAPGAEA